MSAPKIDAHIEKESSWKAKTRTPKYPWSIVEFEVDQSSKYFGVDCGAQVGNIILLFLSFSFRIDRKLAAGIRCTVKIDPAMYGKPGVIKGSVVSPAAPREDNGMYWGYTTRFANQIDSPSYSGIRKRLDAILQAAKREAN